MGKKELEGGIREGGCLLVEGAFNVTHIVSNGMPHGRLESGL
jgi:hypothetical protein